MSTSNGSSPTPAIAAPAIAPATPVTRHRVPITISKNGNVLMQGVLDVPVGGPTRDIEAFLSVIRHRSGTSEVGHLQITATLEQTTGPTLQQEVDRLSKELSDEQAENARLVKQMEGKTFDSEPRPKKGKVKAAVKKPAVKAKAPAKRPAKSTKRK